MGEDIYYKIFEDVDTKQFKWKKEKNIDILKWFLKGFNEEFINEMELQDNIDDIKKEYLKCLKEYMEILKEGLI